MPMVNAQLPAAFVMEQTTQCNAIATADHNDEGKPHAPITISINMCTLFAEFKCQEILWKLEDFKRWEGALVDVVNQVINEHLKQDDTYGMKQHKEFTNNNCVKITLFTARLSAMKCILWFPHIANFCLGTDLGFCGCLEHHNLEIKDISLGVYFLTASKNCVANPVFKLEEKCFTKQNKLSVNNHLACNSPKGGAWIFHDANDGMNIGHALHELLGHCCST